MGGQDILFLSGGRVIIKNRQHAGRLLAARLGAYRGRDALILAIPRGGVVVGATLAEELGAELDVILVTKLRAPGNPELAIGAVTETGEVFLDAHPFMQEAIHEEYRRLEIARAIGTLRTRRAAYTPGRPPANPAGREVIVVDDGIATGSTMIASLKAIEARKAARRVAAAPIAPLGMAALLSNYADEVVLLDESEEFFAVSHFYEEFGEVGDWEVISALEGHRARRARRAG